MNKAINIQMFYECRGEHSHTYIQIMVPMEQPMTININDQIYKVMPQELCLIPKGMPHECDFSGRILVLNLTEALDEKDKVLLNEPIVVSMRGQILQLVEMIQAELKQNPSSQSIHYLYNYLYSKLLEDHTPPSIRYISKHYDLPITVGQLAEIERYNVTYYNDWFKQQTGVSPGIYLRHTRIEKAKELLINTTFSVTHIAVMVGYSCNSTFTRAFRNVTGMTPKEYRQYIIAETKTAVAQ
ncbi:AraC family transcriptional regulator [Pseudoramibacter sp.]|jgi:AraC-like DNA-binding protein|uniref:AraC family transcriptional regulator n=1 Tax=Pseudoramibacter sp. TaxID=2034862 RepID=UPI0025FC9962|nr:AraC family transcriptional regulator [Pseudoramibacter sp.]MCH4072099.1 AraC family transcriptional regulator [Pseudoramibacter sp.]MCH4105869.1 AraC family transcriptional regulator [Pseudoramibacter sp.]